MQQTRILKKKKFTSLEKMGYILLETIPAALAFTTDFWGL